MKKLQSITAGIAIFTSASGCGGDVLNSIDPGGGASTLTVVSLRKEVIATGTSGSAAEKAASKEPTGEPASVTGRVLVDGSFTPLGPLFGKGGAAADPTVCAKDAAIPDETLVVGDGGGLANVFVYLDKAPVGGVTASEPNPLLDQLGCIFKPRSVLVQVGQPFPLKNSDPVPHNVATSPKKNGPVNNNMLPGTTMEMLFKKAEKEPFESKCAIHSWMKYYTLVLDHPYAAISGPNGRFEIKNLPAGKHQLRVWHERVGMVSSVKVDVAGGNPVDLGDVKIPVAKLNLK